MVEHAIVNFRGLHILKAALKAVLEADANKVHESRLTLSNTEAWISADAHQ